MKVFTILSISFFLLVNFSVAEDGMKEKFEKIQMNINDQNYIIFEDDALIICDRESDIYLVEITPESDLYIESKRVKLDARQKRLINDYYEAQYILFSKRNAIGAKGLHIGIESAKLAITAVGGVVELALSGFDDRVENEFEHEMEWHTEKIEKQAEGIEEDAEEFEYQVKEINRIDRKINRVIEDLDNIDLSVEEDLVCININTD